MDMRARLKSAAVKVNRITERAGIRLQPVHYYSEVPSRRALHQTVDQWNRPLSLLETEWDLDEQLAWLRRVTTDRLAEVDGLAAYGRYAGLGLGPGFGPIESQVLHCAVRHEPPARIIEVGSGVSTAVMTEAVRRNREEGRGDTEITCVEPYAFTALETLDVSVLREPVQALGPAVFEDLAAGDLLFIDSSHAVRTGSDVIALYLDVIPRLRPGVRVHIHDVYLPYLFRPTLFSQLWDWQETTLLAALLVGHRGLVVDCCLSALHHGRTDGMREVLPDYRPAPMDGGLRRHRGGHIPSSIWLRTVG